TDAILSGRQATTQKNNLDSWNKRTGSTSYPVLVVVVVLVVVRTFDDDNEICVTLCARCSG
ncbi:MAG: hypothetical protein AB8I80_23775, partial [Anaerolineae bacterium]